MVIIGGGVIGLCCACYARVAGHGVTVIDRNPPTRDGCSFGNAGMVTPSHFIPLAAPGMVEMGLRMMGNPRSPFHIRPRLSRDLWRWGTKFCQSATVEHVRRSAPLLRDLNLASRAGYIALGTQLGADFGLRQNGLIVLCRTEAALAEEAHVAKTALRLGLPAEVLDQPAIAKLEPGVDLTVAGGVYYPKDCHLNPGAFMAAMQSWLEENDVRFLWQQKVTALPATGGSIEAAITDAGPIGGDEYVLAGGAWSPALAKTIGFDLPMQAGKGYSLTIERPRQLPKICAILAEARVAVTPMGASLRFGGTMEIAGMDESINPERIAGITDSIPKYLPAFGASDFAGVQPWRGLRPCSPDGLPYIGRTSRAANLIIATGHAMMGISLGPITGQLVAQIINGGGTMIPIGPLSPERFEA